MSAQNIFFNYIITIHNKENLIRDVILNVLKSAGPNSCIYPVLDGCSDSSEAVIDDLIRLNPSFKIVKLFADDVHELKSINIGLNAASQVGEGYNIVLQDDVLLQDPDLEQRCILLYSLFDKLGLVSFRHGANISRELIQQTMIIEPWEDYIQSECGHYPDPVSMLKTGSFIFKEVVIKSPLCIPFKVIREAGKPDEAFAPWDDAAYCYRVSTAGFANGVFAVNFRSDVAWGTTRNKRQKLQVEEVMLRNLNLFRNQNPVLLPLDKEKYNNRRYVIFNTGS